VARRCNSRSLQQEEHVGPDVIAQNIDGKTAMTYVKYKLRIDITIDLSHVKNPGS